MNSLVKIEGLTKSFGHKTIFKDITLEVFSGDVISVIWENGRWKSTFLKTALNLIPKTSWKVTWNTKKVAYIPQKINFDKTVPLTVREFIRTFNNVTKEEIKFYLEKFDALDLFDKNIPALSWGQLQRVLIANALLSKPDVLIMDEPTAWIDVIWEKKFFEMIDDIKEKNPKMAIMLVSHNIQMVSSHSTRVLFLHEKCHCCWKPKEINDLESFKKVFGDTAMPYEHQHDHTHNQK